MVFYPELQSRFAKPLISQRSKSDLNLVIVLDGKKITKLYLYLYGTERGYSSVVEHSTADREVPGSNPGVPLPFYFSFTSDHLFSFFSVLFFFYIEDRKIVLFFPPLDQFYG